MKLVTICIAAYNAEKYIGKAIESALAQVYDHIEILICDDCSSDKTEQIAKSYKDERIKLQKNAKNLGYLRTFNKLLNSAKGEFICFIDADDFIDQRKVSSQVEFLTKNSEISLVGTGVCRTDESGSVVGNELFPQLDADIKRYLDLNVDVCFCGSSVMIRKEVITLIGGYREYFIGCPAEDFDWLRRISEKFKCANLEGNYYFYRYTDGSLTRKVHYDIKARYAADIAKFLSNQRKQSNSDSLMNPDIHGLSKFIQGINKKYQQSPGLIYRKTAFEHALNSSYRACFIDLKIAFRYGHLSFTVIKTCMLICAVLIFPNSFLLKFKNFFGLNNISGNFK